MTFQGTTSVQTYNMNEDNSSDHLVLRKCRGDIEIFGVLENLSTV